MKKIFYLFCFLFLSCSPTTYIPFYNEKISITENGVTNMAEGNCATLSISTGNNDIKFTVNHELLTLDKKSAIKSADSDVRWTTFTTRLNQGNGNTETLSSDVLINTAKAAAASEKSLDICLEVENCSNEDVLLTEINSGVNTWHLSAKNVMTIHLKNPTNLLQLRVSNSFFNVDVKEKNPDWEQKDYYVSVSANNHVERVKHVLYEDDNQVLYYNIIGELTPDSYLNPDSYKEFVQFDKYTGTGIEITREEIERMKKQKKQKDKSSQ